MFLTRQPVIQLVSVLNHDRHIEPGLDLLVVADDKVLEESVGAADDHQEESSGQNIIPHD